MKLKVLAALLIVIVLLLSASEALSFSVPDLPPGNLVVNPWFRSAGNPNNSGLDGWTDAGGFNKYWSSSQKIGNPTPEILVSGVCSFEHVYCGTAARLALTQGESGGVGVPGVDAYLYQVVPSTNSQRKLKFFTHWVSHRIDPASVSIFGSESPNGPWTAVWTPFYHQQDVNPPPPPGGSSALWEQTGFLSTTLDHGYSFYKIEIHARLPQGDGVGFKIAGVYFSTEDVDSPPGATPTATATTTRPATTTPPATPTSQSTVTPQATMTPPPPRHHWETAIPIILADH